MTSEIITRISPDELALLVAEKVLIILNKHSPTSYQHSSKPEYITRKDAAARLSITLATLRKYTVSGKIKAYRLGGKVKYKAHELDESLHAINTGK